MMRDWLSAQALARPDGAALIIGAATLTYRALHERTAAFAARLAAAGVERGTVVGVLLSNRLEAALAVHAAPRLGVTLALFNTRLTPVELDGQVRAAECRVLVCERDTLPTALAIPSAPRVLCVDPVNDQRLTPINRLSG
ncbi:MAG: AMP-binding protein, partial [Anaerolineae bacterium]|nr:AMP-binding protein [Anaerolineae bacterium]